MKLLDEIEDVRGEPIEVFDGDPMDIPCIETSDAEKLCKHPVVSVHMITYNHESYIRQAIEGVMMQKTDFEFELVIGEDASQDKTREICFNYQKQYPDKIRVLWWHENVSKLGGNGRRVTAHCRGEFIAFCEGDDYWIDPLKLQNQVDAFRRRQSVGLCFAQAEIYNEFLGTRTLWSGDAYPEGFLTGQQFFMWLGFGKTRVARRLGSESFIMTASVMVRKDVMDTAIEKYDIFKWRLLLCDSTLWLGVSSLSDVFFIKKPVCVYRQNASGATCRLKSRISRDGLIVRMYYAVKVLGVSLKETIWHLRNVYAQILFCYIAEIEDLQKRASLLDGIDSNPLLKCIFFTWRTWPLLLLLKMGFVSPFFRLWGSRFVQRIPMLPDKSDVFNKFYDEISHCT